MIPISKYVVERNPYWEEQNILTGYWYDEEAVYEPDEKLRAFWENGEKPVILALGAMSFEDKSEKENLDMFVHAFKKAGCRAIIQGFQKTLQDYELPSKDLSEQSIYEAIIEMKSSYDEKRKNAEAISDKIKSEGGVKEAVRLIENVMQG